MRNYVQSAVRHLQRHRLYAGMNVLGLASGVACCILMLLYVRDEFTFDAFHAKADRIYRLIETRISPPGEQRQPFVMGALGPALCAQVPEVAATVRMRDRSGTGRFTVGYRENRFYEGEHLIAEGSFFDIFDFPLLKGDPTTALAEPRTVVLTERTARKIFGDEDPMGKMLFVERIGDTKVTGILRDPPDNSHLQFSLIISLATLEASPGWKKFIDAWNSDGFITYAVLHEGVDPQAVQAKLSALLDSHKQEAAPEVHGLSLQPLRDVHFGSGDMEFDRNSGKGEKAYVGVFMAVAFFVLLIACINYINLATARAMTRAREIGMRKVAGASRSQLVVQFLGESTLLSLIGSLLALAIVEAVLPMFNAASGKELSLNLFGDGEIAAVLVLLSIAVGVLSGIYPALYLAGLSPLRTVSGRNQSGPRKTLLRRSLVVLQFALSAVMIAATLTARSQLDFIREKNLGFDREQLVVIDINSGNTRRNYEAIKAEIARLPGVKSVSVSSRVPGDWKDIARISVAGSGITGSREMNFICIDEDFLRTFRVELAAGRNLSSAMGADTGAVLINQTAAHLMGLPDPLGREVTVSGQNYRARVVGVVKDFHFRSLHESIGPLVLGHVRNPVEAIDYFTVRLQTGEYAPVLAALERIHQEFDKLTPFEFNFLDQRIDDFYRNDQRVGSIFTAAAILAITIACIGLFGLMSFATEQRTKEIGVRKVLGSSVGGIVILLSREFIVLVVIANVIAWPAAYLLVDRWLQDFAYRIDVGIGLFVLSGGLTLAVAWLTVSYLSIHAALANPVESLRYE